MELRKEIEIPKGETAESRVEFRNKIGIQAQNLWIRPGSQKYGRNSNAKQIRQYKIQK